MRRYCWIIFAILLLSSCSNDSREAQGYIEGRYTYMATPVSGVLTKLSVARGSWVKKGQLLFTLEEQPESDAYYAALHTLEQSIAARNATIANLTYAKLTFERNKILVPQKALQQSELDKAKADYDALTAQLAQANSTIAQEEANLAQAKWTKEQKTIFAPVDAIVFDTYYRLGEFTIADQAILSLLAPADIKVIFYIPQPDLAHLQLNDKVLVHCAGCAKEYTGRVSFIAPSAEYTPPVIYSTETNDKLIYRIEAEFAPQDAIHLHPGEPVAVTYRLSHP